MTGKRILMVDDDDALRASLAEQLQLHEEFETVSAGTAAEALEIVKTGYFDVVLLDVGLPDMDGRECCRLMSNLHHCSHCRTSLEMMKQDRLDFDIVKGGITCNKCTSTAAGGVRLTKGTVKQLLWVTSGDLFKAARMKFTSGAIREGLEFLEAFVPYHLGKQPRSLKFLRQIRDQ